MRTPRHEGENMRRCRVRRLVAALSVRVRCVKQSSLPCRTKNRLARMHVVRAGGSERKMATD